MLAPAVLEQIRRLGGVLPEGALRLADVRWPAGALFEARRSGGWRPVYLRFEAPEAAIEGPGGGWPIVCFNLRGHSPSQGYRLVEGVDPATSEDPFLYLHRPDGERFNGERASALLADLIPMEDRLSDVVIAHVRRLGGALTPGSGGASRRVRTRRGERDLPEPIRQWSEVNWPKRARLVGCVDGREMRRLRLDLGFVLEGGPSAEERDYFMIGDFGGGNYGLCVDLDDADPRDPLLIPMDNHDSVPTSAYDFGTLSEFLEKLTRDG